MPREDLVRSGREAAERARQQAAAAAFGVRALGIAEVGPLIDDAVTVCCDTLRADLVGMLEATAEPNVFRFRAGVGWRDDMVGSVVRSQPGSAVEYMLASDRPVIYEDLRTEDRFDPPGALLEHGVVAGMGVIVRGRSGVIGVLGVHVRAPRSFTDDDANFLQTMANALSEAIERARAEEEMRRGEQRFRQLAENARDIIYRYRLLPNAGYEYINPAVTRITGYTPEECYADPSIAFEMIHPDDRAALLSSTATGADVPRLTRYARKDGESVWCELRTAPIYDESGILVAVEGIARDVSERKRIEDQLRQAYEREHTAAEQLRQLDSMKNAFLQAVSHELRTPLSAVLGMSITLHERAAELAPADRDMLVDRIAANARELDLMLSDLLDLDRLMRRTIEPVRRPTLIRRLLKDVTAGADTAGRALRIAEADAVINVDTPKVERIVANLVINATRHTHEGATIWLKAVPIEGGVELIVEDDGPGIPDEFKEVVFEPFRRGPSVRDHAPGAGIGLTLVAKFAELHGGRAWAEDRAGGGTSMHVTLLDGEPQPAVRVRAG